MGAFFTNYQVRCDSLDDVCDALPPLLGGSTAYVSPPKNGWVTVYDRASDDQNDAVMRRLAMGLSRALATHVIAFLVHDSDILMYFLYARGQLLDEFNNAPDYFGDDVDDETRGRISGDAAALLPLCPAETTLEQVEAVLHPEVRDVFVERTLEDLATVMGIDGSRASLGFKYFEEDGGDALPDSEQFVLVSKSGRRKSRAKRPKAAKKRRAASGGEDGGDDVPADAASQMLPIAIGMLCMSWTSQSPNNPTQQMLAAMGAAGQKQLEMMRAGFDKEAGRMLAASGIKHAPTLAEFVAARDAGPEALAALIAEQVPQAAADVAIGAAAQGNEPIVRALLAHPGVISPGATYTASGMTLLHAAAQGGLVEVVRQMIAQGADVNAVMHGEWMPLHAAARNGGGEIVAMLLENGARIDAKTDHAVTPLMLAPSNSDAARLLRAAGATE
jgi:hypothetical protein